MIRAGTAATIFFLLFFFTWNVQGEIKDAAATTSNENDAKYMECFKKADYCLGKYDFEQSIKECESALHYKPNDYLVRAIQCLDCYEIAEPMDPKQSELRKKKNEIYEKMVSVAEEGIRCAPDHGECYFMRGLAHARLATTHGIMYSLFMAKGIEKDWLRAVKCQSEYRTPNGEDLQTSSYIALGSYYRLCPSFIVLKLLFGINGDINKSVNYCRMAYEHDPTRIEIVKEYGVSLITRGLWNKKPADIEKGKELLRSVATLPLRLHTDPIDIEHSKLLLKDITLCPEYSRDQQQDLSEKAFREAHGKNIQS
ncbi:MAG: hypothetical protein ABSH12_03740 [Endomicrobiales bacterium]